MPAASGTPGSSRRNVRRMPASGSSAMTRAPVAASGRVSLPVPAAMSVTRVPGASRSCSVRKSTAAAGSSGRPRS